MGRAGLALAALLVFNGGCPPASHPPQSRREALERVNVNLREIRQPVSCPGLVSFKFRDAKDNPHSFMYHEARLIYQTPQSLFFDVRAALGGSAARFGSSDERYWLWIDVPDLRKLWWGRWERIGNGSAKKLPVPPNELLDALMLRPLPETLGGGPLPVLRVDGDDHRLVFLRLAEGGQPVGYREIRLDPCEPYQPVEIVDRLPDGQVAMHAQFSHYRRIGADGPFTPRKYVVEWPLNHAEMRLDIHGARFRPDLPGDVFDFPAGWRGEVEQIDAPARGALQP